VSQVGPFELLILLLFFVVPGVIVGRAASGRGMSGWGYGLLAGFFSWLGLLLLLYIDRQPKVAPGKEAIGDATLNRLVKLTELRERGALTPEEFEAEKAKLHL
jgi:Short C-terminal domain